MFHRKISLPENHNNYCSLGHSDYGRFHIIRCTNDMQWIVKSYHSPKWQRPNKPSEDWARSDTVVVMRDDEHCSDFISRTHGISLIWVIAFPLAIVLYGNFPNASITVLALAVVATLLVIIVFPGRPERVNETTVTQEIELPQNEILVIRYLRLFFLRFDRFIWNFMVMWMWPFFVGVGNLLGMVALLELGKSAHPSADTSLSIVRILMITLWFFLPFCYWYMAKYYPDDYKDGQF